MSTFFMFGKYLGSSTQQISADRTKKAVETIKRCGGEVKDMYALLGDCDLVFIADFPGIKDAMKASLAVGRMVGLSISTAPAVSVAEFDKLAGEI